MRGLIAVLVICGIAGCSRCKRCSDNSVLSITSGFGISNIVTLGMNYEEIAVALDDVKITHTDEFRRIFMFVVPSLALCWEGETTTGSVSVLTFVISPNYYCGGNTGVSFRGNLDGRISFAAKEGVTEHNITNRYGSPRYIYNWSDVTSTQEYINMFYKISEMNRRGEPYALAAVDHSTKELRYPNLGLSLVLFSNRVVAIDVFRPVTVTGGHQGTVME